MPSNLHEVLIKLFRDETRLAPELLRDVFHAELPPYTDVHTEESTLTQLMPTEYHADLVLMLRNKEPVYGIVVEVQLQRDEQKAFTWPLYVTALRARFRCPVDLLVVTADSSVARWAAKPLPLGRPDSVFCPYVLGPEGIPQIRDVELATARPHLAVLSALAHGNAPGGLGVLHAAFTAVGGLDAAHASMYHDASIPT